MYSKLLALALLLGTALGCDPRLFNVYVYGDFSCQNSDTEGRLAAGGSVSLSNYAVGCQIYNTDSSTTCIRFGSVHCADHPDDEPSLVVGQSLTASNLKVYAGNVKYGTTLSGKMDYVLDCTAAKDPSWGTYVKSAFPFIQAQSDAYAAMATTGSTDVAYGGVTFTSTSNDAVFSVSAATMAAANGVTLNVPATVERIVINVSGTGKLVMGGFGYLGPNWKTHMGKIMWNFNGITTLQVSALGWMGSLLAPKADIKASNGVFWGQIWAQSYSAINAGETCSQINWVPFSPKEPDTDAVCGNSIVDAGEQCDGGVCCNSDCTFVSAATKKTCRESAGECDVPEMCSGTSSTCPADAFKPVDTPCGSNFGVCDVQLKENCPGDGPTCKSAPPAYIFYWDAFNVLSFDSYTCHGGDVEGRLAARNAVDLSGFTLGLEIKPTDPVSYYELVVAGNGSWTDGSVNRGGNNNEGVIALSGHFDAPEYLQSRRDTTAYVPFSLFDDAATYFKAISDKLHALSSNAVATVTFGDGLLLTCTTAAPLYVVKVPASTISTTNWYLTSGCSFNAAWVIDVTGSDTLNLKGSPFSGVVERVIYNVAGGNSITANNGVAGNILAPRSNYYQTAGVTYGRVIVGNVTEARQNNKPNCIDFKRVEITNKVLKRVDLKDDMVFVVDLKSYAIGDQICINGNCRKIVKGEVGDVDGDGKIDNIVVVDAPFATTAEVGSDAVTTIASVTAKRDAIPITEVSQTTQNSDFPEGSAASTLMVSAALFAIVAMFF